MSLDYPEELAIKKNKEIINNVLKKQASLKIKQFSLEEDFKNDCSNIFFILNFHHKANKQHKIKSNGSGMVDALFMGIINEFSDSYVSLKNISLYDFLVNVNFKESNSLLHTDAPVEVKIILQGSPRSKLYFKAESKSLAKAAIGAVCSAIEYLINAELAVIQLSKDIKSADKRQRNDLQDKYTSQLSELVKLVSYTKVINNLNKK
jgi:hypothetical protein